jgi:hypothetical protein
VACCGAAPEDDAGLRAFEGRYTVPLMTQRGDRCMDLVRHLHLIVECLDPLVVVRNCALSVRVRSCPGVCNARTAPSLCRQSFRTVHPWRRRSSSACHNFTST